MVNNRQTCWRTCTLVTGCVGGRGRIIAILWVFDNLPCVKYGCIESRACPWLSGYLVATLIGVLFSCLSQTHLMLCTRSGRNLRVVALKVLDGLLVFHHSQTRWPQQNTVVQTNRNTTTTYPASVFAITVLVWYQALCSPQEIVYLWLLIIAHDHRTLAWCMFAHSVHYNYRQRSTLSTTIIFSSLTKLVCATQLAQSVW